MNHDITGADRTTEQKLTEHDVPFRDRPPRCATFVIVTRAQSFREIGCDQDRRKIKAFRGNPGDALLAILWTVLQTWLGAKDDQMDATAEF